MDWYQYVAIYLIGYVLFQMLVKVCLRSEPTAHGHIVGTQMGCVVGLVWPILIALIPVAAIWSVIFRFKVGRWP